MSDIIDIDITESLEVVATGTSAATDEINSKSM
jgi:hypothetical protein